jgi:hypothetical protein
VSLDDLLPAWHFRERHRRTTDAPAAARRPVRHPRPPPAATTATNIDLTEIRWSHRQVGTPSTRPPAQWTISRTVVCRLAAARQR